MNKYTYSILGLCVLSLIFLGIMFTGDSENVDTEDNQPVDLSVDYMNGTHLGYINSFKSESGRTYLSIDFLQSFITKKGAFLAAVEDGVCRFEDMKQHVVSVYPDDVQKKIFSKMLAAETGGEAHIQFAKFEEKEILELAAYSGCFPNGIDYTRNRSVVERERIVAPNFTAELNGQNVTFATIIDFLKKEKIKNTSPSVYMITLKNSIVTKLEVVPN